MRIVRTQKAESDIKEIYKYSFVNFGEAQAEKYHVGLEEKFRAILEKTAHNQDYSFIAKGLKRANFQNHAIYYRIDGTELTIVRVLHQKMDELRHLDSQIREKT